MDNFYSKEEPLIAKTLSGPFSNFYTYCLICQWESAVSLEDVFKENHIHIIYNSTFKYFKVWFDTEQHQTIFLIKWSKS